MKASAVSGLAAAIVVTTAAFNLASAAALPSPSIDEELMSMSNEFQLTNGQSRVIAQHKHPEAYRLCVKQSTGVVPVQVTADGKVQNVNAGSCADFNAAKIAVAPAAKLAKDEVLVGKFKHVSKA